MYRFGKVLPNRKHVVLCNTGDLKVDDENVEILESLDELEEYINSEEECFVIGGGMIYSLLLDRSEKLYITKINADFEGDTFFPEIKETEWQIIEREKGVTNENNPYDYEYITYVRKK